MFTIVPYVRRKLIEIDRNLLSGIVKGAILPTLAASL